MSSKVNVSTLVSSEILSGILISVAFAMAICVANIDLLAQLYKNFVSLPISFGYCKFTYQSSLINHFHLRDESLIKATRSRISS